MQCKQISLQGHSTRSDVVAMCGAPVLYEREKIEVPSLWYATRPVLIAVAWRQRVRLSVFSLYTYILSSVVHCAVRTKTSNILPRTRAQTEVSSPGSPRARGHTLQSSVSQTTPCQNYATTRKREGGATPYPALLQSSPHSTRSASSTSVPIDRGSSATQNIAHNISTHKPPPPGNTQGRRYQNTL